MTFQKSVLFTQRSAFSTVSFHYLVWNEFSKR